jgi:hypothetical protein
MIVLLKAGRRKRSTEDIKNTKTAKVKNQVKV